MITDLHLQCFRSYTDDSFEFSPGVNIIVGPNASGKTNLLEAILMLARGNSYRAHDNELVQHDEPWARLEAHTSQGDNRVAVIEKSDIRTKKQFKINNQPYMRLSLAKILPAIVFEPTHLQMLSGAPEERRQFLDDLLEQTLAGFGGIRRQYRRALAQRNSLLKKGYHTAAQQLFAWNIRLSELGSQIATARSALVADMNRQINPLYHKLSRSKTTVELVYKGVAPIETYGSALLSKLEAHTHIDCERGFTSYGPHREDMEVLIDGHPIAEAASRGENRTLMLTFKIIEATKVEEARGLRPLLLLDDVFSELDGARRQALTTFLKPYQTFITTTDADVVIQHFTEAANIIPMEK